MTAPLYAPWFRTPAGFGILGLSLDLASYGQPPAEVSPVMMAATEPSPERRASAGTGGGASYAERILGDHLSASAPTGPNRPSAPASRPSGPGTVPGPRFAVSIMSGKRLGQAFPLEEGRTYTIGFSPTADINLPEAYVSRLHAEISISGGELWIRDLDSVTGTFLRGVRLKERKKLALGDRLVVGTSVLVVVPPAPEPADPFAGTSSIDRMTGTFGGDISLADILQLYQQTNADGVVTVRGEQQVRLHLSRGSVVFAEMEGAPHLSPFKVVFRLFTWKKGSFEKLPSEERTFENPLQYPPGFLLMEVIRQLDELNQLAPKLPAPSATLSASKKRGEASLDPAEEKIMALVKARGTFQGVLDHADVSDLDAARAVLSLIGKGLVSVR